MDPVGGQPLFRRLLGDAFDALPDAVRALHDLAPGRHGTWRGEATIVRGKGLPARLCAAATRLPPAGAPDEAYADAYADAFIELFMHKKGAEYLTIYFDQCNQLWHIPRTVLGVLRALHHMVIPPPDDEDLIG